MAFEHGQLSDEPGTGPILDDELCPICGQNSKGFDVQAINNHSAKQWYGCECCHKLWSKTVYY